MKVTRRRKALARHSLSSNQSSNDELTPEKRTCKDTPLRSSERLSAKSRRTFHMPNKKAVMDAIPSLPTTPRSIDKLKPRKLVNDFTRVTHRYNYDPVTSDDSELDDFIDDHLSYTEDDDDDDDSIYSEQKADKNTKEDGNCKLKQRHHASILESDSDSENNDSQKIKHNCIIVSESEDDVNDDKSSNPEAISKQTDHGQDWISSAEVNSSQRVEPSEKCEYDNSSSSDSDLITIKSQVKKSKRKTLALISDSDSCSGSDDVQHSKKRAVLLDESDSDSKKSDRLYSSNEDDEKLPSERAQLMAARREARRRLFEQLKAKKRK